MSGKHNVGCDGIHHALVGSRSIIINAVVIVGYVSHCRDCALCQHPFVYSKPKLALDCHPASRAISWLHLQLPHYHPVAGGKGGCGWTAVCER